MKRYVAIELAREGSPVYEALKDEKKIVILASDHDQAMREKESEIAKLKAFVADMFELSDWPDGGDIDGIEFQEAAVKHGILVPEKRTEPCGEHCWCAEYHDDMSTGITCYRKQSWLKEHGA